MKLRIDSYADVSTRCREQRHRAEMMRSAAGRSRLLAEGMLKGATEMMGRALRAHATTTALMGWSGEPDPTK